MKTAIEIAEILLENTTNIYLRKYLVDYINGSLDLENEKDLTTVFEFIAKDNYDISDFGLWEIPIDEVYCFASHIGKLNGSKEAAARSLRFDVYIKCPHGKGNETYFGCNSEVFPSIAEAVEEYRKYG